MPSPDQLRTLQQGKEGAPFNPAKRNGLTRDADTAARMPGF